MIFIMKFRGTATIAATVLTVVLIVGCGTDYSGTYVGYSWRGEASGVERADASQYIETVLSLDKNGVIQEAKLVFWVMRDGYWVPRSAGNAYVDVDYTVVPSAAVPGDTYSPGESMFTVHTVDMMSFYAAGVSNNGITAVA